MESNVRMEKVEAILTKAIQKAFDHDTFELQDEARNFFREKNDSKKTNE